MNIPAGPGGQREGVRPFRMSDAMSLIAATAFGLALARWARDHPMPRSAEIVTMACGCLVAWSVAMTGLALRPPRPPWARLLARPGFAASAAGGLSSTWVLGFSPVGGGNHGLYLVAAAFFGALAIVVAWIAQAWISGREPEAGWVDRAGRGLGACWVLFVLGLYFSVIFD